MDVLVEVLVLIWGSALLLIVLALVQRALRVTGPVSRLAALAALAFRIGILECEQLRHVHRGVGTWEHTDLHGSVPARGTAR